MRTVVMAIKLPMSMGFKQRNMNIIMVGGFQQGVTWERSDNFLYLFVEGPLAAFW